jgi:hypothetical protein
VGNTVSWMQYSGKAMAPANVQKGVLYAWYSTFTATDNMSCHMTAEMILNVHMHEQHTAQLWSFNTCSISPSTFDSPSVTLRFLFFFGGGGWEASWSLPVFSCIQQQSKTSYHSVIHTVSFKLIIYISSHLFWYPCSVFITLH